MMRRFQLLLAAVLTLSAGSAATAGDVVVLRVKDTIQPATQRYIERVIADAERRGAGLLVLELDTPGGLVDSTREIATAITESRVPVVVYVSPAGARAASAGFFILIAADLAVMAPGTNTGAAHPVAGGGNMEGDLRDKAENDVAAMVRSLAKQRGRNEELAVSAVRESASFSADEALEQDLVDLVASDLDELLAQIRGREITRFNGDAATLDFDPAVVVRLEPTAAERFLSVLANPNIAYLLMALGMLGIYVEVTHPGAIFPGAVGTIAMLLALYSMSVLPVNLAGVALICVALVLFLLEVKVASYGLLTVGGLIAFVLGSMMLFDSPIPDMRVSLAVILPTAFTVAAVCIFLLSRVLKAYQQRPMTGAEGMIGEVGKALGEIGETGKVLVHGEYWDARAAAGEIPAGAAVQVTAIEGRRLTVSAASVPLERSEGS